MTCIAWCDLMYWSNVFSFQIYSLLNIVEKFYFKKTGNAVMRWNNMPYATST